MIFVRPKQNWRHHLHIIRPEACCTIMETHCIAPEMHCTEAEIWCTMPKTCFHGDEMYFSLMKHISPPRKHVSRVFQCISKFAFQKAPRTR